MILLWLAALAQPPQAATPRGFMERLYASYRHANYSPFEHPERVFAARLLAAIAEDERLAKGEVGYLDGDPVCQCQDPAGMTAAVTRVTPEGAGKARVVVSIGWAHDPPRQASFSLVKTRAGWRIADVAAEGEPSLVAAIEQANREARARH
jgi:hypothetical protein